MNAKQSEPFSYPKTYKSIVKKTYLSQYYWVGQFMQPACIDQ